MNHIQAPGASPGTAGDRGHPAFYVAQGCTTPLSLAVPVGSQHYSPPARAGGFYGKGFGVL